MSDEKNQEVEITDAAELDKMLSSGYPPASCTFINDLPPRWQVDIIEIACKFIYDDGYNDNKGRRVRIGGGGQSSTLTASYDGCCRSYITLMKAKAFDGTNEEWVLPNSGTVKQGYCGGNMKVHLVPETKYVKGTATGKHAVMFKTVVEIT